MNNQRFLNQWHKDMETGSIYGRPLSFRTQILHKHNIKPILKHLESLGKDPILHAFIQAQSETKRTEDAKRKHEYDAVVSLVKSLAFHGTLKESTLLELKKYRPRRFYPPKRTVARDKDVFLLLQTNWTISGNTYYEKLLNETIVKFIYNIGLRSQEVANLELKDIDLDRQELIVIHGKGNKNRRLGLNQETYNTIKKYLDHRPKSNSQKVFLLDNGQEMSRDTLAQRFSRLAKRAGLDISLHSLRRGFATKNADAGRSLTHIQAALGHSSLVTTQSYIMPDVEAGIREMKKW